MDLKSAFIDLLVSGGIREFVNVRFNGDLIANGKSYTEGVMPYYQKIKETMLIDGKIRPFKLKSSGKQCFLIHSRVRGSGHAGVIIIDHDTKRIDDYDAFEQDYEYVTGYTVKKHFSQWTTIDNLEHMALEISKTYDWFITEPRRKEHIPGLVKAGANKESRGILGYCAVYSQVVIAWYILFGDGNFQEHVRLHCNEILESLFGPGDFNGTNPDILLQLAMTGLMHNCTTILATENRRRLAVKIPSLGGFLKDLKLSQFLKPFEGVDVDSFVRETLINPAEFMEMGMTTKDMKKIQNAAEDLNLMETPVLVHLLRKRQSMTEGKYTLQTESIMVV